MDQARSLSLDSIQRQAPMPPNTGVGNLGLRRRVAKRSRGLSADRSRPVPRRILALCLGGIGDTVLAFAALRDLRHACPNDHITALAMWPQAAELLQDLGVFDEVIQHNFQCERLWKSLWETLKLRCQRYDVSLLAFPANRFEYNAMAFLLGAKKRLGHGYLRGNHWSYLRFLLTERIEQEAGRHVVDENRQLVAHLTGQRPTMAADVRLGPLDPGYHADAARMLGHLRDPLLGIHPGSSMYKGLYAKRWPVERFGLLCQQAQRSLGLQPVVFGNPEEIDLKLAIQRLCPQAYFAHGPTIRHTAALIARCACFVSNDSALAHLAFAVDVPVVMLCGPTDAGEVRPYPRTGRVLQAGLACSPCFRVGRQPMRCTHSTFQACMKGISIEEVLGAVSDCIGRDRRGGLLPQSRDGGATERIKLPIISGPAVAGVRK